MASIWKYIVSKWNKRFASTPEERYPALDSSQRAYRKEFGDIVDKYLIYYKSERDKDHPDAYHRIVYIDAENDVDWDEEGEDKKAELTEDVMKQRLAAISKLNIAHAMPVQNLSDEEVFTFKKILGEGYNAALSCNYKEVDMAIAQAEQYRSDRNKERSRWLLLSAASIDLLIVAASYIFLLMREIECSRFNMISGVMMGAVGAYVSIWSRYGKLDMTGLGTKALHYLEAGSRMLIGAIFAFVLLCALNSGLIFAELLNGRHTLSLFMVIGFIAGFSEKFVPSVLESFVHKKIE